MWRTMSPLLDKTGHAQKHGWHCLCPRRMNRGGNRRSTSWTGERCLLPFQGLVNDVAFDLCYDNTVSMLVWKTL